MLVPPRSELGWLAFDWVCLLLLHSVNGSIMRYIYTGLAGHKRNETPETWFRVVGELPTLSDEDCQLIFLLATIGCRLPLAAKRRSFCTMSKRSVNHSAAPCDQWLETFYWRESIQIRMEI